MAAPSKFIVFDLGSSTLKMGVFQQVQGALTLLDYSIKELGLDPNKEQDRFPFIAEAIQGALAEKGLGMGRASCSISGQFVFTRFVKLPPVAPEQIDQMVVFEAQQNVPFPIDEVVWDYQLLGGKDAKDVEAVIVAVKSDLVEQANSAFTMHKLDLESVDVAPLALVNAFRYNYPNNNDCSLIIDIGAKSTNLVFIEANKVFCRVIPIGGHLISQNISNEFQEPYVAAELLKKGKGFVGLGGAYADPDDEAAARISKIARTVFSRLHAEISRSISFYRNQQNGMPPKAIYLAGGAVAMSYADLFFKEKLNLPVEYLNPLKNINVAQSVDKGKLSSEAYLLGPVVGLGLKDLGDTPIDINLVPNSVVERQKKKGQLPCLVAAVCVWLLLFLCVCGANFMKYTEVSAAVDGMQQDFNEKTALTGQIKSLSEQLAGRVAQADTLGRLVEQRQYWPEIMNLLVGNVSNFTGLWVTQVDLTYNGNPVESIPAAARPANAPPQREAATPEKLNLAPEATELNIRGYYEASQPFEILNSFVASLEKSQIFDKVEIITREAAGGDEVALQFFIRAVFKQDKKLDLKP